MTRIPNLRDLNFVITVPDAQPEDQMKFVAAFNEKISSMANRVHGLHATDADDKQYRNVWYDDSLLKSDTCILHSATHLSGANSKISLTLQPIRSWQKSELAAVSSLYLQGKTWEFFAKRMDKVADVINNLDISQWPNFSVQEQTTPDRLLWLLAYDAMSSGDHEKYNHFTTMVGMSAPEYTNQMTVDMLSQVQEIRDEFGSSAADFLAHVLSDKELLTWAIDTTAQEMGVEALIVESSVRDEYRAIAPSDLPITPPMARLTIKPQQEPSAERHSTSSNDLGM